MVGRCSVVLISATECKDGDRISNPCAQRTGENSGGKDHTSWCNVRLYSRCLVQPIDIQRLQCGGNLTLNMCVRTRRKARGRTSAQWKQCRSFKTARSQKFGGYQTQSFTVHWSYSDGRWNRQLVGRLRRTGRFSSNSALSPWWVFTTPSVCSALALTMKACGEMLEKGWEKPTATWERTQSRKITKYWRASERYKTTSPIDEICNHTCQSRPGTEF